MKPSFGAFGDTAACLWNDPLDRKLALGVIRDLTVSGKYISGLMSDARTVGLGDKLASWLGTAGRPQEFTLDDVKRLIGNAAVSELVSETQSSEKEVLYRLSRIVPQIAGQVVPFGNVDSLEVERVGLEALRTNILAGAK